MANAKAEQQVFGDVYVVTADPEHPRVGEGWIRRYADAVRDKCSELNDGREGGYLEAEFHNTIESPGEGVFAFRLRFYGDPTDDEKAAALQAGLDAVKRPKLKSQRTLADDGRSGTVEYNNELVQRPDFSEVKGVVVDRDTDTKTVTVRALNATYPDVTQAHLKAVEAALQRCT